LQDDGEGAQVTFHPRHIGLEELNPGRQIRIIDSFRGRHDHQYPGKPVSESGRERPGLFATPDNGQAPAGLVAHRGCGLHRLCSSCRNGLLSCPTVRACSRKYGVFVTVL